MEDQQDLDRTLHLLRKLNHHEEFKTWRDEVAKPTLLQLEADLETEADKMEESVLRAKLKHYFYVKNLLFKWFDQVEAQLRLSKED